MFRQYYHYRQIQAFGHNRVRFVPLGSRGEFPDAVGDLAPAHTRKYVFSYMVALTDAARAKVHDLLLADTEITADKKFIHVSKNWHGTAHHEEYVSPDKYREVMLQSAFSICPKGHSVEQFRIYEAIESGSIPVMDLKDGYLAQHLPTEYISSPMLLLESWDELVPKMLALWKDPAALRARQLKLLEWYRDYMHSKVAEIENELVNRRKLPAGAYCQGAAETPVYVPPEGR